MPFFHSRYLKDDKKASAVAKKLFSAFQYNDPSKKKTVHFATIEVQQYNWDYTCDPDVYYLKKQIAAMNKQRFTDASKIRKQRNIKLPSKKDKEKAKKACDDVDIAKRATDITQLLQEAFDPERDTDEQVSICGIEHFVYPALQKEMIQRKKQAQREVINFNKPNPQGWRLARLCEANTKWARDVAVEKGKRYCKRAVVKKGGFFSAFQYNDPTKKKTVHFATIEVQPYNWDYTCDKDVYYSKTAITAMNKQRFTDASKLRKQRNIKVPSKQDKEKAKACDDVDIAKRTSDIQRLLEEAFDPERDIDEEISIRGIEHFVYPALQQEMIRRKKHAKREIVNFRKEKRPDPRGWRLARLSEVNTQWARDVAIEKGMRYCMNQEAIYGAGSVGLVRMSWRGRRMSWII
ncbi:hypothetical protein QTG54_007701 [Skeletonema marinoi]|uniref:Uncharacterized protein n=1 Tax=Skeletonema marinoi TaxID=267567 RepID=A0AAD8YAD0_9STRA|nr:hypothetical protein QTG54_007701 [Skeletonema marinoi]